MVTATLKSKLLSIMVPNMPSHPPDQRAVLVFKQSQDLGWGSRVVPSVWGRRESQHFQGMPKLIEQYTSLLEGIQSHFHPSHPAQRGIRTLPRRMLFLFQLRVRVPMGELPTTSPLLTTVRNLGQEEGCEWSDKQNSQPVYGDGWGKLCAIAKS